LLVTHDEIDTTRKRRGRIVWIGEVLIGREIVCVIFAEKRHAGNPLNRSAEFHVTPDGFKHNDSIGIGSVRT
jgi:hypothetical protein